MSNAVLPDWWLVLSAICFGFSILLNFVLIIVSVVAWTKISPLLTEAKSQVKQVGDKATDITTTAKDTVQKVHDRADQILGTAEQASSQVTQRIGAASAALTAVFVVLRIAAFARGMMHHDAKHERRART